MLFDIAETVVTESTGDRANYRRRSQRQKVVRLSHETAWILRGTVENGVAGSEEIKWKRLDWDCEIRLSKIGIAGLKRKSRLRRIEALLIEYEALMYSSTTNQKVIDLAKYQLKTKVPSNCHL